LFEHKKLPFSFKESDFDMIYDIMSFSPDALQYFHSLLFVFGRWQDGSSFVDDSGRGNDNDIL